MDELADRFLKSLGIILGGFLLIYFLISISGERPMGVSLIIYECMNTFFYWTFRIILFLIVGFILVYGVTVYSSYKGEQYRRLAE